MWTFLLSCAHKPPLDRAADPTGLTLRFVAARGPVTVRVDSDERSTRGGQSEQTEKTLVYHHRLEPDETGFVFRLTHADIERMEFDGTPVPEAEVAKMLPVLALVRPAITIDADGQFVGLAEGSVLPPLPGAEPAMMLAAAREQWTAVAEGWPGVWTLGEPRIEQSTLPWPLAPGTTQPATITRTVLACDVPLPCVVLERRVDMAGASPPGLPPGASYLGSEVLRITSDTSLRPTKTGTEEHLVIRDGAGTVRFSKATSRQETWQWAQE